MYLESTFQILVTGSSGFVGAELCHALQTRYIVLGIDRVPGKTTDIVSDLSSSDLQAKLEAKVNNPLFIINCAAAKDDFGLEANTYHHDNVQAHKSFIEVLQNFEVARFIHISSVAAIDGESLQFNDNLDCDDAYRRTKYLQEALIVTWCRQRNIEPIVLLPSAIYGMTSQSNNIDALFSVAKHLSFAPKIDSVKSSTFMGNFIKFIEIMIENEGYSGRYLCVEKPVLRVYEYLKIYNKKMCIINIPFIRLLCVTAIDLLSYFLPKDRDYRLTPSRLKKLFSDTKYSDVPPDIDCVTYNANQVLSQADAIRRVSQYRG